MLLASVFTCFPLFLLVVLLEPPDYLEALVSLGTASLEAKAQPTICVGQSLPFLSMDSDGWLVSSGGLSTFGCTLPALPCRDQAPTDLAHMWVKIGSATAWLTARHSAWGCSGWSVLGTNTHFHGTVLEVLEAGGCPLPSVRGERSGPRSWLRPDSETLEHFWSWLEMRTAWSAAAKH